MNWAVVALLFLSLNTAVWAGGIDRAGPGVLPFDGALDLDGVAADGDLDMRFSLFGAPSGGEPLWSEPWTASEGRAVALSGGHFHVALGRFNSLSEVLGRDGALFLGIEIKQSDAPEFIVLAGRQQLDPVAHGLWSLDAEDLTVVALDVGGDAEIAGEVVVSGDVTVDGHLSASATTIASVLEGTTGTFGVLTSVNFSGGTPPIDAETLSIQRLNVTNGGAGTLSGGALSGRGDTLQIRSRHLESTHNFRMAAHGAGDQIILNVTNSKPSAIHGAGLTLGSSSRDLAWNNTGDLTVGGTVLLNYTGVDLSHAFTHGATTVGGETIVGEDYNPGGALKLTRCRLCMNYTSPNGQQTVEQHSCVELNGAGSGFGMTAGPQMGPNHTFELVYVCDNGGTSGGAGLVTP